MIECLSSNLSALCGRISDYFRTCKKYNKRNTKTYVYDVPVSFDTECSNITDPEGQKVGCLYIWMFRFGNPFDKDSIAVYGRSTEMLDKFLWKLSASLKLFVGKRESCLLYVYVHNLGYDIEFIRDKLNIVSQLHADTHSPIFVRDARGFEFRDSYILAGNISLKKIGEELDNGLSKKCGDLNYDLYRTPETPLTDTDLGYCQGDIDVLASYIQKQKELYGGIQFIPLTNTGRVRKYARDVIYKSNSYGAYVRYRQLMDECVLSFEEYDQCQRAFFGGFTHANAHYVGEVLENVTSYDFTSSYPAVMLSERFPMGKPEHFDSMTYDEIKEIANDPYRCCIFDLQMSNVFIKDDVCDCYLSGDGSKVHMVNPEKDNGRVRSCEKFAITCSDVDFKIIRQCYDYDKAIFTNILVWRTDYLPTALIGVIIDLYKAKTTLKGVKGKEEEYQVKKAMLNSLYGMCVTRILRDKIELSGDSWNKIELSEEEKRKNIDKNNDSKLRILYYPWGVFITSYARFNLWTAIKTLGSDYIYSDTDSIKVFAGSKKIEQYLEDYHSDLETKLGLMLQARRKFKRSDLEPLTIKGKKKPIGVWDYEGTYSYFKTLGSKRYLLYDGNFGGLVECEQPTEGDGTTEPTVAGIDPGKLSDYLIERSGGSVQYIRHPDGSIERTEHITKEQLLKCFELFKDRLEVPAERTGKLASFYYSDVDIEITDYINKKSHIQQKFGVHLAPVNFTLTMSGSFLDLVLRLKSDIANSMKKS